MSDYFDQIRALRQSIATDGTIRRLWEALDFTKAGRIPRAGRLKKVDGSGEEYVDAWVFYKKFDEVEDGQ